MASGSWIVLLVATIVSLCNAHCYPASLNLVNWSSKGASWMAKGASIVIPKGTNVLLDVTIPQPLGNITVFGGLYVDNKNINVSVAFINVFANATFVVGTQSCPITAKVIFEFYGPRLAPTVSTMGADPFDGQKLGSKGIAIQTDATFIVYGAWQGTAWTNLASTALAGATTLRLRNRVYWKAGDSIIVTSTDFALINPKPFDDSVAWQKFDDNPAEVDQTEKLTIKSVDGTGTIITLTAPLKYTHWGADYQYAEVGLLTRNVVFQGDASSDSSEYGAQLMMRKAKQITIIGAEFMRGGQKGILGRYPIHFHFIHFAMERGYTVAHSSSHDNYHRCLTVHETSGVLIQDFVAYKTSGHIIFLEVGGETKNVFDHCLAAVTSPIPDTQSGYGIDQLQTIPSDVTPSGFWITNGDNIFKDCAAAGGAFAFWFALPYRVLTDAAAAFHPADYQPKNVYIGNFYNNTAHSAGLDGVFVGEGGYEADDGVMADNIIYKNRRFGTWSFQQINQLKMVFLDNGESSLFYRFNKVCRDSLFWNDTPNKGISNYWKQNQIWKAKGYNTYDSAWGSASVNNVFKGFNFREGGAIHSRGPAVLPNQYILNNTFTNSKWIDYSAVNSEKAGSFVHTDGGSSVSGFQLGGAIISIGSNLSFPSSMTGCKFNYSWPALICPLSHSHYHQMWIGDMNQPKSLDTLDLPLRDGTTRRVTNSVEFKYILRDAVNPKLYARYSMFQWVSTCYADNVGCTNGESDGVLVNMPVRRFVSMKFIVNDISRPTPPAISVGAYTIGVGEWQVVSIPYPTNAKFKVNSLWTGAEFPRASSYAALNGSNYFYDSNTELLWVMYYGVPQRQEAKSQSEGYVQYFTTPDAFSIKADCGGLCNPTLSKLALNYPPPTSNPNPDVVTRLSTYVGSFSNCAVDPNTAARTGTGSVRVTYSADWKLISVSMIHDLSAYKPVAAFGSQAVKGGPITWFSMSYVATSPSRWGMPTHPSFLAALYAGTLFVQLNTTLFPNGHVRANLQCSGSCPMPVMYTVAKKCTPPSSSTSLDVWPATKNPALFSVTVYGNIQNVYTIKNDSYYSYCGSPAIVVPKQSFLELQFYTSNFQYVSATPTTYRFLEMYVRIPPNITGNVRISVFLSTTKDSTQAVDLTPYAMNGVQFSDLSEYQLVSVPLTAFGRGSSFDITRVVFEGYSNNGVVPSFAVTQLRFVYTQTALTKVSLVAGKPAANGCSTSGGNPTDTADADLPLASSEAPVTSEAPTASSEAAPTTPADAPTAAPSGGNDKIASDSSSKSNKSSLPIIIGCAVGGVAVVAGAVAGAVFYRRRRALAAPTKYAPTY